MKRDQSSTKPSARVQRKRAQARREILDTAARLLQKGGVEAVTLESVAGALDMTRQALYHYFPSKEALMRALVTDLLDTEVRFLLDRISETASGSAAIAALIRSFHAHYIERLGAFRAIYGQTHLYSSAQTGMDPDTIRKEVNPRTRGLFDALEARLLADPDSDWGRNEARRYAYAAWTSALGLVTMLSVADAVGDPLIHRDSDLLDTLVSVFSASATIQG